MIDIHNINSIDSSILNENLKKQYDLVIEALEITGQYEEFLPEIEKQFEVFFRQLNDFFSTLQSKKSLRSEFTDDLTELKKDIILQRKGLLKITNLQLINKHKIWHKVFYELIAKMKNEGEISKLKYWSKPVNVGRPKLKNL